MAVWLCVVLFSYDCGGGEYHGICVGLMDGLVVAANHYTQLFSARDKGLEAVQFVLTPAVACLIDGEGLRRWKRCATLVPI
jgi:hypothetical protein